MIVSTWNAVRSKSPDKAIEGPFGGTPPIRIMTMTLSSGVFLLFLIRPQTPLEQMSVSPESRSPVGGAPSSQAHGSLLDLQVDAGSGEGKFQALGSGDQVYDHAVLVFHGGG